MRIAGMQKVTLLDYPGKIACTVFLAGCNMRCPFCHNSELVLGSGLNMPTEEVLDFLNTRRGKLEGVCVTGGEPTIHEELPVLLRTIQGVGFSVKLDTNGTNPQMLRRLVEDGLVDYLAMDIKNAPECYAQSCGGVDYLKQVRESAAFLLEGKVDYEFRTTVCSPLHGLEEIEKIGQWLTGAKRYYLQQFVDSGRILEKGMTAVPAAVMEEMRQCLLPYIPAVELRGI